MGSLDFNATTSIIDGDSALTEGAKTGGAFTLAAWAIWDGAGEASSGTFFKADTNALIFRFNGTANVIRLRQLAATTSAEVITSTTMTSGQWYCVIGTFDESRCHVYLGTPNQLMTECTYSTNTAISGAFTAWNTRIFCGNSSAADNTFDGRLLHAAVLDWAMDRTDQERYRTGDLTALFARGNPRQYFTLSDSSALVDSSRRGHGVNTSATSASSEMPAGVQFRWDWAGRRPL